MNFSICFASRERVPLLTNLLQSLVNTTKDLDKIEVLVGIDYCDVQTCEAADGLQEKFPFVKFLKRQRSKMLNKDYINWVYDTCGTGDYIIACNDDAAFITPNWDEIILGKINHFLTDKPDGIVYGYTSDTILNRFGMNYCCFPTVSRKACKVLGWIMPPEFPGWNADIRCWEIYHSLGRTLDISEVTIEHISYHSGKRGRDAVSHHVEKISSGNYHSDIKGHIAKLRRYIENAK